MKTLKYFSTLILVTCITTSFFHSNAQPLLWEQTAGGDGILNEGKGISTDPSGNCYVTGYIQGLVNFSTTVTFTCSEDDIFIAKYSGSGTLLWVKQAGGTKQDRANAICTDAQGNSYITGNCQATAQFDAITIPSGSFVAKYDQNGNCVWATSISCIQGNNDICLDANGNVYVLGNTSIAKFDPSGNCVYTYQGGTFFHHAMCYSNGYIYTAGSFTGIVTVDTTTLTSQGDFDVFVIKYDTLGNVIWAKSGGGPNFDDVKRIAVDALGNSYVLGSFFNSASFGTVNFFKSAVSESFLVKYDAAGNVVNGTQGVTGSRILIDASNNWQTTADVKCYDKDYNSLITGYTPSCKWSVDAFSSCLFVRKKGYATGVDAITTTGKGITISPNPASNYLTVKGIEPETTLKLYDILGKQVYQSTSNNETEVINISDLTSGNYILETVNIDGSKQYLKLSIEK